MKKTQLEEIYRVLRRRWYLYWDENFKWIDWGTKNKAEIVVKALYSDLRRKISEGRDFWRNEVSLSRYRADPSEYIADREVEAVREIGIAFFADWEKKLGLTDVQSVLDMDVLKLILSYYTPAFETAYDSHMEERRQWSCKAEVWDDEYGCMETWQTGCSERLTVLKTLKHLSDIRISEENKDYVWTKCDRAC